MALTRIVDFLLEADERISAFLVLPECSRPYLKAIEYAVHGFPWLITSSLGSVIAYSYKWPESKQYGLLVLNIGLLLDLAVVGLVKIVVQRDRPPQNIDDQVLEAPIADRYSFPSGHTSRAALLAVLGSFALPRACLPFCVCFPLVVAYSRVAMGRHYVSDVLAGLILGAAQGFAVLCTPLVVNRWVRRLFA